MRYDSYIGLVKRQRVNETGNAWKEIIVTKLEMVHGGTEEDSL